VAEKRTGPVPYEYVCTRLRVRKSKLLAREDYLRMLNMSIPEMTRFIEETQYKKEIDELGTSFSGIDLLEIALSWNLAKEYQNIQKIAPGDLKRFTQSYLRRWDIQNVLTILRGKAQGITSGKIKEILIPAGELDRVILDRLLKEESPERVVEALKAYTMYPVLTKWLGSAIAEGSFAHMENALYRQFYGDLIEEAMSGFKGGRNFLDYIRLEIDMINIRNMFRLRADRIQQDAREIAIPGGTFGVDEFQRLVNREDHNEFIDAVKSRIKLRPLLDMLETIRQEKSLRETEIELIKFQIREMESMSKRNPFSIHPILTYLEKKKYEIINLRALARGKESNLPTERIRGFLVI